MVMKVGGPAGYAPGKTITALIDRFRNTGLPSPLTMESLQRVSVSESLAPRTLQTLKLLDLVDEQGKPTQQFEDLRRAPTAEFKSELITLLKSVYADVFDAVEPASATLEEVQDAFRYFTPQGQRDRMASLFLSLLEYAEYSDTHPRMRASSSTPHAAGGPKRPRTNRNGKARVPTAPSEPPVAPPVGEDTPGSGASSTTEGVASSNEDMKRMYFELLLKKADSSEQIDTDLLDRIERLVGIAPTSDAD